MWGPLVFLAIISCLCGLIPFGHFVSATGQSYDIHIDMSVATTSVIVAIIGIGLATYMYAPKKTPLADALAKKMPKLHKAALNRFYIDDAWQFFTHKIVFGLFSKPIAWFDRRVIDVPSTSWLGVHRRQARLSVHGRVVMFAAMLSGSSPVQWH